MSDTGYAFSDIDRLLHAPARLSIVTALYANRQGRTFTQLKQECQLSDGNLSRHVARLEEDLVVLSLKEFVNRIPRTTVRLTSRGISRFEDYIDSMRRIFDAQQASARRASGELLKGALYE